MKGSSRNSQKLCGAQLKKLAPSVQPNDRREAMAKLNISYVTVSRYLNGHVANLILGMKLLSYFKTAIQNRDDELKQYTE